MTPRLEAPEEAAERLAKESLSPSERVELWNRIEASAAGSGRRRRHLAVSVAALASAVCAVVVVLLALREPKEEANTACELDSSNRELSLPSSCESDVVRVGADDWHVSPGSTIVRVDDGARLVRGSVEFHVEPRSRASFRVRVSGGHEVRVVGTVFHVQQHENRGSVSVSEGVIEFVWSDGEREMVRAGQTLTWPRPSRPTRATPPASEMANESEPAEARAASRTSDASARAARKQEPAPSARAPADLESVMDRVLQLKSQRRFGELIGLLRRTLGEPGVGPVQRERLSYELGLALEGTGQNACAHWRRHARTYGVSRYRTALEGKLERCDEP